MLKELCDKYFGNINTYNQLENYDYRNIDSKHKVLEILRENTQKKHAIFTEQNAIVTSLYAVLNDMDSINQTDYDTLRAFAEKLSQSELEHDNAIAFEVRKALLAYAKKKEDYSEIINETEWCGICQWKYYKIDRRRPDYIYFESMKEYEDKLPFVTPEIRIRYIAAIINQLLYYTNEDASPLLEKGREVLAKYDWFEATYPDTPLNFKAFRSVIYRNMLTCEKSFCKHIDDTEENVQYAYEIAQKSMELIEEKEDTSIPFETVYFIDLYTAQFHAHVIDIDTLLKKLEELSEPGEEYSTKENYNRILRNTSLYITYIREYSDYDLSTIQDKIIEKVNLVFKYISRIKRDEDSYYVSEYIRQFVSNTIDVLPFEVVKEVLFRTTISQHRETCVHNLMVQKLSNVILAGTIEQCPEKLLGVMGFQTVEEIRENKQQILQVMEDMALVHDVGKYQCINIISNASRKLEDREFEVIKLHPIFGYEIIKKAPICEALKDGVLLHHRWHNGNGGYPQEYPLTVNQPLVDILSTADCLDAATDPFGRSYALPKTLDQMIAEFKAGEGTRYASFVITVFNDPMIKLKVDHLLNHTRNDMVAYICQKNYNKIIEFYPEHIEKNVYPQMSLTQ